MVTDINSINEKRLLEAVKAKDWEWIIRYLGVDKLELTPEEEAEAWAAAMQMLDEKYGHLPADEPMPEFTKRRLLAYWQSVRKQAVALDYTNLDGMNNGLDIWKQMEPMLEKAYPDCKLMEWRWIICGQVNLSEGSGRHDEAELLREIAGFIYEVDSFYLGK